MERCVVCGNVYEKAFRVVFADRSSHVFDSFECAIHAIAPRWSTVSAASSATASSPLYQLP